MPAKVRPTRIPGYKGTNYELGETIAKLRYDQIPVVLEGLAAELKRQADAYHEKKRYHLAGNLLMLPAKIDMLKGYFEKVISVSKTCSKTEHE